MWAPGPVWTGAKNLALTRIQSPDRPVALNIIIINILTAIGLAPGGSSPVYIYREHYIEYTNNRASREVYRKCMSFVKVIRVCEALLRCKHFPALLGFGNDKMSRCRREYDVKIVCKFNIKHFWRVRKVTENNC